MSSEDLNSLRCAVDTCGENPNKAKQPGYNISFHRFPTDLKLQQIWAQKCGRKDEWDPQTSHMCSMHFRTHLYDRGDILRGSFPRFRILREDAVPTLNLPADSEGSESSTHCIDPEKITKIREFLRKYFSSPEASEPLYPLEPPTSNSMSYEDIIIERDTSSTNDCRKICDDLLHECDNLKIENKNLLEKIENKKNRKQFYRNEVTKAFELLYYSRKAYMYVRDELHYPLPGLLTFQRWAKSIDMRRGLISDVLKIMELNSDNIEDHEKLTVLLFDELKVRSTMEYDELHDVKMAPRSQMLVVMALGIASKWKQPIFVDFDVKMSKIILLDIIDKLEKIGYKVICCVTNCGVANIQLWNELEITYENPTFCTPDGRRIVYIPDSHHLLKLARNWLLDTGFCLNGAEINKKPLEALVTKISSQLSPGHKLKREHLTCKGPLRKNIELAKQLLSHSTAIALQHYRPIEDFELLNDTIQFVDLISNWFDLVNVSNTHDKSTPFKSPYGTFLYEQDKLLNEMYNTIILMRCKGSDSLQIFQSGFLMHINGTKQLLRILKKNGLNNLLTSKINKDALTNLFYQIYSGGDHPTPLNAMSRLRMIMSGISSNESSTNDNKHEEFIVAQALKLTNISLNDEDDKEEDSGESDDKEEDSEESDDKGEDSEESDDKGEDSEGSDDKGKDSEESDDKEDDSEESDTNTTSKD